MTTVKVGAAVSAKQHAQLEKLAKSRKTTIGTIVRSAVERLLTDDPDSLEFDRDRRRK
jgi:hypothetical protein